MNPNEPTPSFPRRLVSGMVYWFKGLQFLIFRPALWTYLIIPLLINLVLAFLVFHFGWTWMHDKLPSVKFIVPEAVSKWKLVWLWIEAVPLYLLKVLLWIITFLVFSTLDVLFFVFFAAVIGSPFYDFLAMKIERLKGFPVEDRPFSLGNSILYPMGNALKMTLFSLFVALLAFGLNYIPLLGNGIYVLLVSFPLSMNLIAYAAERRLWGFFKTFGFVWKWKWEFMGFGLMAFAFMMPFGLNVLTFPVSVAGATLLFVDKSGDPAADFSA